MLEKPSHSVIVPLSASRALRFLRLVDAALSLGFARVKPGRIHNLSRHERQPGKHSCTKNVLLFKIFREIQKKKNVKNHSPVDTNTSKGTASAASGFFSKNARTLVGATTPRGVVEKALLLSIIFDVDYFFLVF